MTTLLLILNLIFGSSEVTTNSNGANRKETTTSTSTDVEQTKLDDIKGLIR